jgi:hypothetical protein
MRERESFLRRMEERLARVSAWLAERRRGKKANAAGLHVRTETIRREIALLRRSAGAIAHQDLARVRASLDGLRADYDVPPPHYALRRAELDAFRRHLQTAARLASVLSNVDDPGWDAASEEYERSWAEVERAFESQGDAASP